MTRRHTWRSGDKARAVLERSRYAADVRGRVCAHYDAELAPCACPRHTYVGVDCLVVERLDGRARCLQCGQWFDDAPA